MNRLTHARANGIKTGYWSPAKKEELAQRLAAYEDTGLEPGEVMDGRMLTGWIPVSDRLPQNYTPVLGQWEWHSRQTNEVEILISTVMMNASGEWVSSEGLGAVAGDVSAWMPLPEIYRAGDHDEC